jgi:hypothetical protein
MENYSFEIGYIYGIIATLICWPLSLKITNYIIKKIETKKGKNKNGIQNNTQIGRGCSSRWHYQALHKLFSCYGYGLLYSN